MTWDDDDIALLRELRSQVPPASYRQIARRMGRTRNAVCQAVHRYVLGEPPKGGKGYQRDTTRPIGHPKHWTDAYLTERYADRKKRQGRPPGGGLRADASDRRALEA